MAPRAGFGRVEVTRVPGVREEWGGKLRWRDFDRMAPALQALINEYGEADVQATARFLGTDDPELIQRGLLRERRLRQDQALRAGLAKK